MKKNILKYFVLNGVFCLNLILINCGSKNSYENDYLSPIQKDDCGLTDCPLTFTVSSVAPPSLCLNFINQNTQEVDILQEVEFKLTDYSCDKHVLLDNTYNDYTHVRYDWCGNLGVFHYCEWATGWSTYTGFTPNNDFRIAIRGYFVSADDNKKSAWGPWRIYNLNNPSADKDFLATFDPPQANNVNTPACISPQQAIHISFNSQPYIPSNKEISYYMDIYIVDYDGTKTIMSTDKWSITTSDDVVYSLTSNDFINNLNKKIEINISGLLESSTGKSLNKGWGYKLNYYISVLSVSSPIPLANYVFKWNGPSSSPSHTLYRYGSPDPADLTEGISCVAVPVDNNTYSNSDIFWSIETIQNTTVSPSSPTSTGGDCTFHINGDLPNDVSGLGHKKVTAELKIMQNGTYNSLGTSTCDILTYFEPHGKSNNQPILSTNQVNFNNMLSQLLGVSISGVENFYYYWLTALKTSVLPSLSPVWSKNYYGPKNELQNSFYNIENGQFDPDMIFFCNQQNLIDYIDAWAKINAPSETNFGQQIAGGNVMGLFIPTASTLDLYDNLIIIFPNAISKSVFDSYINESYEIGHFYEVCFHEYLHYYFDNYITTQWGSGTDTDQDGLSDDFEEHFYVDPMTTPFFDYEKFLTPLPSNQSTKGGEQKDKDILEHNLMYNCGYFECNNAYILSSDGTTKTYLKQIFNNKLPFVKGFQSQFGQGNAYDINNNPNGFKYWNYDWSAYGYRFNIGPF